MSKRFRLFFVLVMVTCLTFGACLAAETEAREPYTQGANCNWELDIDDAQEFLYTENGETLKKTVKVRITATKKGGADYFGKYTGKGVIQVFNALADTDDAHPVLYGGQTATTKEFKLTFSIDPKDDTLIPVWEFSQLPERVFDGISTLQFTVKLDKVRGIFQKAEEWPGLVGMPGEDFSYGDEIAMLYTDGGYVSLTLMKHWQVPAPFQGTLIGVQGSGGGGGGGGAQPTSTRRTQGAVEVTITPAPTYTRRPVTGQY